VTAALQLGGTAGDSAVHRLDPRAKTVGLLAVTVIAVSSDRWLVLAACAAVLAVVAALAGVPPSVLWRRGRIVLLPVALAAAFVPLTRTGGTAYGPVHEAGLHLAAAVAAKAAIGTFAAVLLAVTTGFPALLRGLEAMRVPSLLVLTAALMFRYLFVLVAEVGRMRAALAARAYRPRTALQAGVIGRAAAALFLRTHGRAERVHHAMLARGYDRRMPHLTALRFGTADAAFVALILIALVPLRALA
jgi:cobalt/nickel transport system permease protein